MITDAMVQRINELARKKKSEGLTPEELAEQKALYKVYLASIRQQVVDQLEAAGAQPKGHVCDDTCCHPHHHGPGCGHKH